MSAEHAFQSPISIIGYRRSGKTTVGRQLAARLGWRFVDCDAELQRRRGITIEQIINDGGCREFRQHEQSLLHELFKHDKIVVATGGGTVLSTINFLRLQSAGPVIWLRASLKTIKNRFHVNLNSGDCAQFTDSDERVYQDCEPLYHACSTILIDVDDQDTSAIVDMAVQQLTSQSPQIPHSVDFSQTFEAIGLPIYLKDRNGLFLYANTKCATESLRASSPHEVVGKTDEDFFEPAHAAKWRREDALVMNSKAPFSRMDESHERELLETIKLPVRNCYGEVIGILGNTKPVLAPSALFERYRLAFEGARDGLWHREVSNEEWSGKAWYSQRWKEMLGYADNEIGNEARAFWDRVHPDDTQRVRQAVRDHFEGVTSEYECTFRLRHKDQTYRTVHARGMARRNSDGIVVAFAGSHSDVSFYQNLCDTIPGFVFVKDTDCRFTFVNDAVAKAFNRSKEALYGKTDRDLLELKAPVDEKQVRKFELDDKSILRGERPEIVREETFGKGDHLRILRTRKAPLFGPEGEIIGLVGVSTDITDLQKERNLLNNLMESAQDGIFFKDRRHCFTRVNRELARLVGKTPEQMIGKTDYDFFSAAKYADEAMSEEKIIFQTGNPVLQAERFTPVAGGVQWRQVSKVPIKNRSGEIVGLCGISRDVTEARDNNEQLIRQNELLENILNSLPQCIFIKDKQLNYRKCNRSFARRKSFDDPALVLGKTDFDFWPPEVAQQIRRDDTDVLRTDKQKLQYRETQRLPDGTEAIVETTKIPIHDSDGNVDGVLGIYSDITERIKREAVESQREHDRRIAQSIGHCLKGWIAILEGTCLALQREHGHTQNITRLKDGIQFLKHATKVATSHFALDAATNVELLSLNDITEAVILAIDDDRVSFSPSSSNPTVKGTRFHLQNAFQELLANARDFSPAFESGGKISITVEDTGKSAVLHVADNGSGVPGRLKPDLFDLFTTCADHRTGMGLGYVKRVVDAYHGAIDEIGEEGIGAHFVLSLPLQQESVS